MDRFWPLLLSAFILGAASTAKAGMLTLFEIDFDGPPHQVGQTVAIGSPPVTPSRIRGDPRVQVVGGNAVLEFRQEDRPFQTLEQVAFDFEGVQGARSYALEFDVSLMNLTLPFSVFFDTPIIQRFDFNPDGSLTGFQPTPTGETLLTQIGFQAEGQLSRFRFDVNLRAGRVRITQDEVAIFDGAFFVSSPGLDSIRLSLSGIFPESSVTVDNVLITAKVPEPSALLFVFATTVGWFGRALRAASSPRARSGSSWSRS